MIAIMRSSILIALASTLLIALPLLATPAEAQRNGGKPDRYDDRRDQNDNRRLTRRERREAREAEEAREREANAPQDYRGRNSSSANGRYEEDRQTADLNRQVSDRLSDGERRRQASRTLPYLAYTLGELHYLSYACDGLDAQEWRQRMVELMSMEAPDNGRLRDDMIENFNEGYRVQQRFRPLCGPEVDSERRALAHRGQDLADMMREAYYD